MPRSVGWCWKSKFARFVQDYGVKSISLALYVRSSAITDLSPRGGAICF